MWDKLLQQPLEANIGQIRNGEDKAEPSIVDCTVIDSGTRSTYTVVRRNEAKSSVLAKFIMQRHSISTQKTQVHT
jgi:hypothetical protein